MTDTVDTLLIDVRANTQGFAQDVATMRGSFDGQLVDGFAKAGDVLERGLLSALRKGSLGFDDLKRIAFNVIDQIAAQAIHGLFASGGSAGSGGLGLDGLIGSILGTSGQGGGSNGLGTLVGAIMGLPGRATGGPVSPERPYLVGERGPELFVPASAGRVETALAPQPRDVRVAITIAAPAGTSAPQALQRSSRQVASAVRRALSSL